MHLASKGVAWASLNQTVCALRFFYVVTLGHDDVPERIPYARKPQMLPEVPSGDEVVRFLENVASLKARVALTTAYAAGLRVSEVVALEVHHIDSGRTVMRIEHGTTEEAPIVRFARDEAHRLKPLGQRPAFGALRDLVRIVGNDCAVEVDTNSYSVPWRLIGERVSVTIAAGQVRVRHGRREVAVLKLVEGRRQRVIDRAHLDGIASGNEANCRREIAVPSSPRAAPPPLLLRSLTEYEVAIGGPF